MSKEIDENLYSRQLYVLGHEAMKRMASSDVLIVGLNGVGVEVAKNVILTGVKSVTLCDTQNVTHMDLSAQFYAGDSVGQNRLDVCISKLKELNDYVPVTGYKGKLDEEFFKTSKFQVAVFCDGHVSEMVELNELCRKYEVKFIATESRGLCGSIFTDFGKKFEVIDTDGEAPVSSLISNITNDNPGVVTVDDDKRHGLYTGDTVVFEGIEGMEELNNLKTPMPITSTGLHSFTICDTSNFSTYKRGGIVTQVKVKKYMDYDSLEVALKNPKFLINDFLKMERPAELHAAFQALPVFIKKFNRYPGPYNQKDAEELITLAKEFGSEGMNTDAIKLFSFTCQGNLSPMAAFLGGFVGQEVQKACSGKFGPLENFLYFDAFECLADVLPEEDDCKPINSRYDGQIVVFGKKFQETLSNMNYFVVGAGALGCEYLKNFAMMGMGCGKEGNCIVTDMDTIETSNLNRQFLFRKKHVKQSKSSVAGSVVKEMNKELNVNSMLDKVAPDTEDTFDDAFWEKLNFVVNALDNIQARLYVDSRCVYFRKPLLESGTLGTKGNIQVVVPFLTESYGSSRDPPEKEIPICTLKNFPNQIEHTIQYARDLFEGTFKQSIEDTNKYLKSPTEFTKSLDEEGLSKSTVIKNVHENLFVNCPTTFEECVLWARLKFQSLFHNQISQLLYNFPEDMITSSGAAFWSGSKKPPVAIKFDSNDPLHLNFIIAASNLRAFNYGLSPVSPDSYNFKKVVDDIKVPEFKPKQGIKIATTQEEAKTENTEILTSDESEMKNMLSDLSKKDISPGYELQPSEFEKDDDTNFHIEFITAASNLRARNYKIPEADKHKTKGIAGKIIPAMVTTTALVTGLCSLEVYKIVQGKKKLEDYKNSFINIGLPSILQCDPIAPSTQEYGDGKKWSQWDRLDVDVGRDITLRQFLDLFEEKHKLEISMMSSGTGVVYNFFTSKEKLKRRMAMKVSEVVEEVLQKKLPEKQKYINFEICCSDENGDDADVPYIRYKFK
eukprot:gene11921-5326_t